MTFDIPHMIATAVAVFGIIWLVDHVSLFDGMSKGRKTLLFAALGLSLVAAPPLAAQQATDDNAGAVAGAAAPASDALAAARAAFAAGELDPSLVALKTALRQNAFDQDALLLLADVLLARFDTASAEATLRRALDAGAPREQVLPALAKAMILQGQAAEVLAELEPPAGMAGPARARLLTQHAAARMALGESEQAAALLEEALATSDQVSEPFSARAAMAMAGADWDAARADLRRAIELAAWDDEPWLLLGALEQAVGDRAAAEAAYGAAIERAPVHWRSAHARALLRLDHGDLDGAKTDIALAEAQFPAFSGLVLAHARLDLLQGRPDEAAVDFERYLSAMPQDANALFYAAYAANQLGNREQALDYLQRLERVEGQSVRLLWQRAQTLLADDKPGDAWALLRDAVSGDTPPPRLALPAQTALVRLGRTDEALDLLGRARAQAPDSPELVAAEAGLRLAAGELEQAEALTARLLALAPESTDALVLRAQLAVRRAQVSDALLTEVRAARERAPADLRLPVLLATVLAARDEPDAACGALTDALRLNPTADPVVLRLRALDCARRTPELLQDAYQDLLASHPDAVRALPALLALGAGAADADGGLAQLQSAVDADPGNAELRGALVLALLRGGRAAEAATVLEAAPPDQMGEPPILRAAGLLAVAQEEPANAARAFQALLSAQPGTAEPAYLLADAQAQAGDLSGARYHLTEGLRLAPDSPLAAAVSTRIFVADASLPARRQLIDDIKRQVPDSPLVPSLQAQTLLEAGRPDKAAELLRTMHDARPDDPALLARLLSAMSAADQAAEAKALGERWAAQRPVHGGIALLLGDLSAMQGDMQRAAHWYQQTLTVAPNNATALNNLAYLLTASEPREAVRLAERAVAQNPKDPDMLDTLGTALLAAGDSARARELLNQAYALGNQRPALGLNLAKALAADGEPERARALLRELLTKEFPRQDEARALMQRLSAAGAPQ